MIREEDNLPSIPNVLVSSNKKTITQIITTEASEKNNYNSKYSSATDAPPEQMELFDVFIKNKIAELMLPVIHELDNNLDDLRKDFQAVQTMQEHRIQKLEF